jgi:hypothetical protein
MEQVTQQNAAVVEEASASAEQLRRLAENLVTAVSVFKVTPGARSGPLNAGDTPSGPVHARPSASTPAQALPASRIQIPRSDDAEWEEF